jgi:hypothetical protein
MKQYTHAWLAFMAIKRLEKASISKQYKSRAESLVKWFNDHRDFVIQGAWYPDSIIKDMATSHILKYKPNQNSQESRFRKLPSEYQIYEIGKKCEFYKKPYEIANGNLPDRCDALAHGIIDNLKMQESEDKGSPISPTDNHIATKFFMISHYIADAHMPLHCDDRAFSSGKNIHAKIEEKWDDDVRQYYRIDYNNNRFFYDTEGYPLKQANNPLIEWVESEIINRHFSVGWGSDNSNTWDFMAAISQYSYLMSYKMIPSTYDETMTWDTFINLDTGHTFEDYSKAILIDAIDSIVRVWFRVWQRYQRWLE